jgi:hypothetical protein
VVTPWRAITGRARQPRRKRRPLFTCGTCGKGYSSPLGHTCSGGGDLAKRRRAAGRAAAVAKRKQEAAERRARERARIAEVRKTERARARERVAAARKTEREKAKARAAKKRPASSGPRPARHEYASCRDADCERAACEAYRDGRATGYAEGEEAGYRAGYTDGSAATP